MIVKFYRINRVLDNLCHSLKFMSSYEIKMWSDTYGYRYEEYKSYFFIERYKYYSNIQYLCLDAFLSRSL